MPGGRPKGSKTNKLWADALRKAALEFQEGTKTKRLELVAKSVLNKLISGDMSSLREFGERIDGKVPQDGTIDANVTIEIVRFGKG